MHLVALSLRRRDLRMLAWLEEEAKIAPNR